RRLPAVASRSCAARHLVRAAARDVQRARAALEKDQRRPACTACIAANDVSRLLPRKPRALRSGEGLAARGPRRTRPACRTAGGNVDGGSRLRAVRLPDDRPAAACSAAAGIRGVLAGSDRRRSDRGGCTRRLPRRRNAARAPRAWGGAATWGRGTREARERVRDCGPRTRGGCDTLGAALRAHMAHARG